MTALPPELAPWASLLQLVPREIALALGPLVQRLAQAVDPWRTEGPGGAGEIDGFDGLARRESYERLRASDWLLADEAPEEFERRAPGDPDAYQHVMRPEPHPVPALVVLFDAGPGLFGTPRIAYVAALIVLARRAEAAGVRLRWGFVQALDKPPHEEVTAANLRQLLEACTRFPPCVEYLDAWLEAIGGADGLHDLWLVGGERLRRTAPRASRLVVRGPLEPGTRVLQVTLRAPASTGLAREITLPLPDERTCTQFLRGPFAAAVEAPVQGAAPNTSGSNLLFSASGRYLYVRDAASRAVLAITVPNTLRAPAGRPKSYGLEGREPRCSPVIAAVGGTARYPVLATATAREVAIASLRPDAEQEVSRVYRLVESSDEFAPPIGNGPLLPCFLRSHGDGAALSPLVLDTRNVLFEAVDPAGSEMRVRCSWVPAIASTDNGVLYVGWHPDPAPGRSPWQLVLLGSAAEPVITDLWGSGPFRAFLGHGGPVEGEYRTLAYQREPDSWRLLSGRFQMDLPAPPGATVVGVATRPDVRSEPVLIALETDRRTLTLHGWRWTTALPPASDEIVHVTASHAAPHIAYLTTAGEIVVYSLTHPDVVLRCTPFSAP